jgi:hypothetical protein
MRLTNKKQKQVIKMYKDGVKVSAIASQFGISHSWPGALARSQGVPCRKRAIVPIDKEIQDAIYIDYCANKLSVKDIALKYGVSESYPSRLSKKRGGPKRYKVNIDI